MSMDPRLIDFIARICHEANREIQLATGDPAPSPPWKEAAEWQKASALEGVIHALDGKSPEELHDEWRKFKYADGWVYGIHKDPELKTHPCLVPYDELAPEQRLKDNIFLAIVRSFQGVNVVG
jgi:RyR domain